MLSFLSWKWVAAIVVLVFLAFAAGCSVVHDQSGITITSQPPGIFEASATAENWKLAWLFDPWKGIEKGIEGIADLVEKIGGLFEPPTPKG